MTAGPWGPHGVVAEWFRQFDSPTAATASVGSAGALNDRWIVQLSGSALNQIGSVSDLPALVERSNLPVKLLGGLGAPGQIVVESTGVAADVVASSLRSSPLVEWFEKDATTNAQLRPDDTLYRQGRQPALLDSANAQDPNLLRRVIDAPRAWNTATGTQGVVIAVIDSGIDFGHVDLAPNIWTNPLEIPGDGQDNDGNGQIDDTRGYDFVDRDSLPEDENGHGTNVAGVIAARGNNGQGIAGVNWAASLLPVRYLDEDNQGTVSNAVAAVNYVRLTRQAGANIRLINASWGFYGDFSQSLYEAISGAGEEGILFVAASGNGNSLGRGIDLDRERTPFYPASFDAGNIITVGAAAPDGRLAGFSNYGETSVDILAPGVSVLTTEPYPAGDAPRYESRTGTSFAAPFVTGVAGLILASPQGREASVVELRNAILEGAVESLDLAPLVSSEGNLNAFRALQADVFAPRATAVLSRATLTEPGPAQQLTILVSYRSNVGIDLGSIGDGDILIRRKGFQGTATLATFLRSQPTSDAISAFYRFAPLDSTHNGDYEVILRGDQVRDVNQLPAFEHVLGEFRVAIADANLFMVNTTDDTPDADLSDRVPADANGKVSLRAAIQQTNQLPGEQTILLPDGLYRLTRSGNDENASAGDLDVNHPLRILASGSAFATIAGLSTDRVLDVNDTGRLRIEGVTIAGGRAMIGAGIINSGFLELKRSVVARNVAGKADVAEAYGGGIANLGRALIIQSTVANNAAVVALSSKGGGGIYNQGTLLIDRSTIVENNTFAGLSGVGGGGGLYNAPAGTARVVNSTFSANIAFNGKGGGIHNAGTLHLNHATVHLNRSFRAGGLFTDAGSVARIENSIFSGSILAEDDDPIFDLEGIIDSLGDNLIGAAPSGQQGLDPTDDVGTLAAPLDPLLAPLADNGGATFTHEVLPDSPALNEGHATFVIDFNGRVVRDGNNNPVPLLIDQIDNPRDQGQAVADIGAYERFNAVITGRVYDDLDDDGHLDPNEPGRAGITVFLDLNFNGVIDQDEPVDVTRHDDPATPREVETGQYSFLNPPDGYSVRVVVPDGFVPTSDLVVSTAASIDLEKVVDNALDLIAGGVPDDLTLLGPPSVNDEGTIAFLARRVVEGGGHQIALYTGREGQFRRQVIGGDQIATTSVGSNGIVAFTSDGDHGAVPAILPAGVYQFRPVGRRTVADENTTIPDGTTNKFGDVLFRDPRIASSLTLFHTVATAPGQRVGVYMGNGPTVLITLVDDRTLVPGGDGERFARFESTAFGSHDYALLAGDDQSQARFGIYLGVVGETLGKLADDFTIVPDESGAPAGAAQFNFSNYHSKLAIFDAEVGFYAEDSLGTKGVYRGNLQGLRRVAGANTSIPDGQGTFTDFGGDSRELSVGRNVVGFIGHGANGQSGVYCEITTETEGVVTRTIRKIMDNGDLVDGAQPVAFRLGGDAIAGMSLLTFTAVLADGREVIMVANLPLGSQRQVLVAPAEVAADVDFGVQAQRGTLRGTIVQDSDADGVLDQGEPGQGGVTVYLDQNNNGRRDDGELSAVSDTQGNYVLAGLPALTTYIVRQEVADDFAQTFPDDGGDGSWVVPLQPGEVVAGLDFGNAEGDGTDGVGNDGLLRGRVATDTGQAQVGATVFLDADHNGVLDPGERSTRTDATGRYEFSNLPAGTYDVRTPVRADSIQLSPYTNVFRQTQPVVSPQPPTAVALANFDGRNGLDVVVTTKDAIIVMLNNGGGVFTAKKQFDVANSTHTSVVTGDFTGDGRIDIAVGSQHGDSVLLLRNNGAAGVPFQNITRLAPGASRLYSNTRGIAAGDFNNDRKLDLATANDLTSGTVSVYFNNASSSTFGAARTFQAGQNAFAIVALHLNDDNNDGRIDTGPTTADFIDLAVANFEDRTVTLLRNTKSGGFAVQRQITVGNGPASITRGDFNRDGRPDLAVANYNSDSVSILLASGAFQFAPAVNINVPAGATSVVSADMDGDADFDIVVSAGKTGTTGGVSVLRNRGDGTFGAAETQGVGQLGDVQAYFVAAGKIDEGDTVDVVVANGFNNNVSVLTNSRTTNGGHNVEIAAQRLSYANLDFTIKLKPSARPSRVDLFNGPLGDDGAIINDNITSRDNSTLAKRLKFVVFATVPGARVNLFAGTRLLGTAVAQGTSTTVFTNGTFDLRDGVHEFTATQTEPIKSASPPTPILRVTVRTTGGASAAASDAVFSQIGSRDDLPLGYDGL